MMVYIDQDFKPIVPSYLENIKQQLMHIRSLLYSKKYREIERVAMQIRDSGHNYGFIRIGELGVNMIYFSGLEASENIIKAICEIEEYIGKCQIEYIEL